MAVHDSMRPVLDYRLCRYGASRVDFRGPKRNLQNPYVAFLGGTETFGKFLEHPYPDLVEDMIGIPCINFGCMNAGVDVFLRDPEVLAIAAKAEVTIVQVVGALNMSNRYYRVHPRRNDRFLTASNMMQSVFREVDFTDFSFTRHMLKELSASTTERVSFLRQELRAAWCARMQELLAALPGRKLLFWFARHAPPKRVQSDVMWDDPLFIDRGMLDALKPKVDGIIETKLSTLALTAGTEGMHFASLDRPAALQMMGKRAHEEAAQDIQRALQPILQKRDKERPA